LHHFIILCQLIQIKESKENNNGRIDDSLIIRFYRDKLHSMPCQNQGFVLDGFPKTYEQAKDLFNCELVCLIVSYRHIPFLCRHGVDVSISDYETTAHGLILIEALRFRQKGHSKLKPQRSNKV